jgi:oligosaccharyl transferase (archaeosortase A-associated)
MKKTTNWFSPGWIVVILLAIFFAVSLCIRALLPHGQVFSDNLIKFNGTDVYFYLRQIDSLVHNFPHLFSFDPYLSYPAGAPVGSTNFFDYFLATIIWIIGLGSPNQHLIDVVGAYFPAVVGALTVIPVYFIGKTLFNRWSGILAAGLMAIFPGEFLGRSILSVTDRDSLEVLLAATTMLFFILAVKAAREKAPGISDCFRHFSRANLANLKGPLTYGILSGILVGIFTLTWRGSFIFVAVILVYTVVQSILDHLKGRSPDYLAFAGSLTFAVGLLIFAAVSRNQLYSAALAISFVLFLALWALSWLLKRQKIRPLFYPACVLSLGLIGLGIFYAVSPSLFRTMWNQFSVFSPSQTDLTISELRSILFPQGQFSLSVVWQNYTTSAFLSLVSLGILIYLAVKHGQNQNLLFIVWSLMLLAGTLIVRRLALIYVINVALLTGYLGWQIIEFAGRFRSSRTPARPARAKGKREKIFSQPAPGPAYNWISTAITSVAVFFLVFFPNIGPARDLASQTPFAPSTAWVNALSWLKDNTPEPFGSPAAYYGPYSTPFTYPQTAYAVTAWWDYGYWIMRIGHRIPSDDPGAGAREQVAKLFLTQDEAAANRAAAQLNSKYLIIDNTTVTADAKFHAIPTYAGLNSQQFFDVYYFKVGTNLMPVLYYYPEYYQSLAVRLYYFDGQKVTPTSVGVISYTEKVSAEGVNYREIADSQTFPTFAEAQSFVSKQKTGNFRIAGQNPAVSQAPLDSLQDYKLIYPSTQSGTGGSPATQPAIKIFEHNLSAAAGIPGK